MQINVEIRGISQLYIRFGSKAERTTETIGRIITSAGFVVEGESKKVTPVLTGRLRSSITPTSSVLGLQVFVGPHTDYAFFVHEGTHHMASRPFMKWGVRQSINKIQRIASSEIAAALKK